MVLLSISFATHGQPRAKVARLAVVLFDAPATNPNLAAFVAGLHDLGYLDGRNVALEYRHAKGRPELVPELGLQVAYPQEAATSRDWLGALGTRRRLHELRARPRCPREARRDSCGQDPERSQARRARDQFEDR